MNPTDPRWKSAQDIHSSTPPNVKDFMNYILQKQMPGIMYGLGFVKELTEKLRANGMQHEAQVIQRALDAARSETRHLKSLIELYHDKP